MVCFFNTEVEKTYEQSIQQREERAAVALELEKEKHALRQMRGKRYTTHNPGEYKATSNPLQPVYVQVGQHTKCMSIRLPDTVCILLIKRP